MSKLTPPEQKFVDWCKLENITGYEMQYRYEPSRKWRADFAFVDQKILIEINGSDHFRSYTNIHNDYEKWNHAQMLGWKVFCFATGKLYFEQIKELIK
jgi:very-short-patch-repair endonuclease